ncbi:MAG: endolytic transglycosylase MltG [Gammaproteobacteria bacterium]|nr:endolytic transglycosylase MltG [Gammaproteobacteria bacterium]MBT5202348.1 endolytic transglycosylase MltG [Gammaproteobacteria bacterium]MBT5601857.1 endolytic transglycosylase MltG [Gammaproteobacteria bacterium]MBT6245599.1 endolytic transglycosylase MltG [Gammaproteobacteria bacterium]
MNKSKTYRFLLVIVVVFSLTVLGVARAAYRPLDFSNTASFLVSPGTTLYGLARTLNETHLQIPSWLFLLLARVTSYQGPILAGEYAVHSELNSLELLMLLRKGVTIQRAVTFVEGWTFSQWRAHLSEQQHIGQDSAVLTGQEVMQRVGHAGSVTQTSPEGWFFPDTYFYSAGDSDLEILRRAHRAMLRQLQAAGVQHHEDTQLDRYEVLILASMVEKESGHSSDRNKIAAVFLNRLRQGMRLQSDPTVIYGMGDKFDGNLVRADLIGDTAHNTYVRKGLPPTPICMPGKSSIDSVMNPAQVDFLYFVARGDGSSEFSMTLKAHNRAVRRYQINN